MSDAAAAVATAAPASNGAQTQTQAPAPVEPAAAPQQGRPRDELGRFAPRPGETQAQADARGAAEAAAPKADPLEALRSRMDAEGNVSVKVRGKVQRVHISQVPALLETEFAGKQLFTEANRKAQEAEAALARLRSTPDEVLRANGIDPVEFAYQQLERFVQQQQMTPEQRQALQFQQQLEQQRQALENEKKSFEQQRYEAEQAALLPLFTQHVPKAMETLGLPKTGAALEHVVAYLRDAQEMGEPMTPDTIARAAEAARDELREQDLAVTKDMSDEQFAQWLGPERLAKVTRYQVAQYEAKRKATAAPAQPAQAPAPTQAAPLVFSEREHRLWKEQGGGKDIQTWLREYRTKK